VLVPVVVVSVVVVLAVVELLPPPPHAVSPKQVARAIAVSFQELGARRVGWAYEVYMGMSFLSR
jgi:hypothetical protein